MASLVSIDDIIEGMVLAEPVINNFGQTLLPQGIKLNPKHKIILKTWNVSNIYIQSDEESSTFELSDELKEKANALLRERMIWEPEQKIEKDLFNIAIVLKAKSIISNNSEKQDN